MYCKVIVTKQHGTYVGTDCGLDLKCPLSRVGPQGNDDQRWGSWEEVGL
jgi:hypothetical protein